MGHRLVSSTREVGKETIEVKVDHESVELRMQRILANGRELREKRQDSLVQAVSNRAQLLANNSPLRGAHDCLRDERPGDRVREIQGALLAAGSSSRVSLRASPSLSLSSLRTPDCSRCVAVDEERKHFDEAPHGV